MLIILHFNLVFLINIKHMPRKYIIVDVGLKIIDKITV